CSKSARAMGRPSNGGLAKRSCRTICRARATPHAPSVARCDCCISHSRRTLTCNGGYSEGTGAIGIGAAWRFLRLKRLSLTAPGLLEDDTVIKGGGVGPV